MNRVGEKTARAKAQNKQADEPDQPKVAGRPDEAGWAGEPSGRQAGHPDPARGRG
ncbi:hypothetical protein JCM33774_40290 [Actinophytocola sp. KF-1]